MAEPATSHRVRGGFQVPFDVGESRTRGEVVTDAFSIWVLALSERAHEVSLREDSRTWLLRILDDDCTDVVVRQETGGFSKAPARRQRQHLFGHRISNPHHGSSRLPKAIVAIATMSSAARRIIAVTREVTKW